MVDKIVLENNWMLDAKKVRLSLALLPGSVVLFVAIGRGDLNSGIYRYPKITQRTNKSHEDKCNAQSHDDMSISCKDIII